MPLIIISCIIFISVKKLIFDHGLTVIWAFHIQFYEYLVSQTSQPSPGSQSSCSSDQSPTSSHLGRGVQLAVTTIGAVEGEAEEDQKFKEENEKKDTEGEEEKSPFVVSTVSTDTDMETILALQTCRNLGQPLRWMEQVKMERLRQVNRETSRLGHVLPNAAFKGHCLPSLTGKGKALFQFALCMFCPILTNIFNSLFNSYQVKHNYGTMGERKKSYEILSERSHEFFTFYFGSCENGKCNAE